MVGPQAEPAAPEHHPFPRSPVGGVWIAQTTLAAASAAILDACRDVAGRSVHLVNAYSVSLADQAPDYARTLNSGWLALADGRPLQWLSRLRRDPTPLRQVRGADLMRAVAREGLGIDARHFLLGSTGQTLALLDDALRAANPGISIAGTESRPFRPLGDRERDEEIERIRASRPDIVWVCLGTPAQDIEAAVLAREIDAVVVAVGAAFDFLAGSRPEAPHWVTRLGFEWLFRLASEPRRLHRRYLIGNARFLRIMAAEILAARGRRGAGR